MAAVNEDDFQKWEEEMGTGWMLQSLSREFGIREVRARGLQDA